MATTIQGVDAEVAAVLDRVVGRFFRLRKGTPVDRTRKSLLEKRRTLSDLVTAGYLRIVGSDYIPTFKLISEIDPDISRVGTAAVNVVLAALRNLYIQSDERNEFSLQEIVEAVKTLAPGLDENDVVPGLFLAVDFGYFVSYSWPTNAESLTFTTVGLTESILDFSSAEDTWQKVTADQSGPGKSIARTSYKPTAEPKPTLPAVDVFLSHASEDKGFIRELASALKQRGITFWLDEIEIKLGDSLRASIDRGLAHCRFGVVILSKHFFAKHWPQQELNGLAAIEDGGRKVILPIWHGVTQGDVAQHSPMLADRKAVATSEGLDRVVGAIVEVVQPDSPDSTIYGETNDLHVGTRVRVRRPVPGVPRDQWPFDSEIYVIRKTDDQKKTAIATPVLPPINGPTPTVEGPMSGPYSPFKRAKIPS